MGTTDETHTDDVYETASDAMDHAIDDALREAGAFDIEEVTE